MRAINGKRKRRRLLLGFGRGGGIGWIVEATGDGSVTMISLMAVGETPSPSLDCLNFLMAIGEPRRPPPAAAWGCDCLRRARKTRP